MNCILIFLMTALSAQPADEWNELTNQTNGWLGADGVYSAKNPADGSLYFWFSDTLCGTTQDNGRRFKDIYMVNHSFWHKPADGKLEVFIPEKGSNLFPDRYWIQDGVFLNRTLYLFAMRCGKNWKPERIDLISLPIRDDGKPDFAHAAIEKDIPLQAQNEKGQVVFHVHHSQPRDAGGRGGNEKGVDGGKAEVVRGAERQHQQAGSQQDHQDEAQDDHLRRLQQEIFMEGPGIQFFHAIPPRSARSPPDAPANGRDR